MQWRYLTMVLFSNKTKCLMYFQNSSEGIDYHWKQRHIEQWDDNISKIQSTSFYSKFGSNTWRVHLKKKKKSNQYSYQDSPGCRNHHYSLFTELCMRKKVRSKKVGCESMYWFDKCNQNYLTIYQRNYNLQLLETNQRYSSFKITANLQLSQVSLFQ